MRHPPARMTARRRTYRLAAPPPSVLHLLSPPLLHSAGVPDRHAAYCATYSRLQAPAACRRKSGSR